MQASQALNHCPPPSRIFHGRHTILNTMHQFFGQDTKKQKIYVLYRLGGAGKTQIALKFIKEWTHFTAQLLVDASTTETIETGLKNIATAKQSGNSLQDALNWLVSNQEDWLLFFDNADDPEINLNQFFPKCNHGNILITSRNPNLRVYGTHSRVSDMEELDAVALLLKSACQEMSAPNKLLALDICNLKVLWYLPLGIVQAGAFIAESGTLDTYLDLFSKNRTKLLKKKPNQTHDDYAWAVYTTWEMSFNKLSRPAAMLLQLCSFIHGDDITENIFSRAANYARNHTSPDEVQYKLKGSQKVKSKFMKALSLHKWDSLAFLKLTNELRAYSLINFDVERKSFSIHPLVHTWSQTTLNNLESYQLCMNAVLGMSIDEIQDQDMQLASLRLLAHVDSLMHNISEAASKFYKQYAYIYYYAGQYTRAVQLEIIIMKEKQKLLGDDHLDTLSAMHSLAVIYDNLGRFEEAEKLQVVVLEKRRKLLGDDHLDTLHAMHSLAVTYSSLGRFVEAEKLKVVVLEKRKKLLGDGHLDTLRAMENLAITYDKLGRFEEAEKLKVAVLEKRRKLLGDGHLDTLHTMHSLAVTYSSLRRFVEAEKLKVVVLEKRKKLLGDGHLDTLRAMENLAITYDNLGRFEEAEKLQVVVLEKQRKLLGDDHLGTLHTMHSLAVTYSSLGVISRAGDGNGRTRCGRNRRIRSGIKTEIVKVLEMWSFS
ncbi:hypothetical protein B0H12DRAFT_1187588 [Mycena haematopus]|nr:hypothetical protein B0H12DRAFT_1187588 [Mycena haematopus]